MYSDLFVKSDETNGRMQDTCTIKLVNADFTFRSMVSVLCLFYEFSGLSFIM